MTVVETAVTTASGGKRENLRTIVRGAYDIQKLRIQMGNRIVGNFKAKLGQEPGEKEGTIDSEGKQILRTIRAAHKKITDGVKTFPRQSSFVGDEVISDYTELCLVAQYVDLETHEAQHFRRLGTILKGYPVFSEFLHGVKGVGPAMAGVIISEIDIHKARYPSSLWAYAGLDVVAGWKLDDVQYVSGNRQEAEAWLADDKVPETAPLHGDIDPKHVTFSAEGPSLAKLFVTNRFSVLGRYKWDCKGGRSRRREHLREVEYTDRDGKPAKRVGITFNPFLKTKLVGVLASSFLRCGDSPYAEIYGGYKHRMESHARYGVQNDGLKDDDGKLITSKGRRHNQAMRYMIKRFLVDLYKAWRPLEGLDVAPEYSEAKLGRRHVG